VVEGEEGEEGDEVGRGCDRVGVALSAAPSPIGGALAAPDCCSSAPRLDPFDAAPFDAAPFDPAAFDPESLRSEDLD
jgi:hypothetical protein